MALYLVRHAIAGDRLGWSGADRDRPLSVRGHAQAQALAQRFAPVEVARVLSSPYVRCLQTVGPLAQGAGLPVEAVEELAEGRPMRPVLDWLPALPDSTVLCSHGDLIPDLVEWLRERGGAVEGPGDWRNASTWVLERDAGTVVALRSVAPPVA